MSTIRHRKALGGTLAAFAVTAALVGCGVDTTNVAPNDKGTSGSGTPLVQDGSNGSNALDPEPADSSILFDTPVRVGNDEYAITGIELAEGENGEEAICFEIRGTANDDAVLDGDFTENLSLVGPSGELEQIALDDMRPDEETLGDQPAGEFVLGFEFEGEDGVYTLSLAEGGMQETFVFEVTDGGTMAHVPETAGTTTEIPL